MLPNGNGPVSNSRDLLNLIANSGNGHSAHTPHFGQANGSHPRSGQTSLGMFLESLRPDERAPALERIITNATRDMVHNAMISRAEMMRKFMDPKRDIAEECSYPKGYIDPWYLRALYEEEGIAAKVVEVYAKASWEVQPLVYESHSEDDVTGFEASWDELGAQIEDEADWTTQEEGSPVMRLLRDADILSGIGAYGVIFLGLDDGLPPSLPARGIREWNSIASSRMTDEQMDAARDASSKNASGRQFQQQGITDSFPGGWTSGWNAGWVRNSDGSITANSRSNPNSEPITISAEDQLKPQVMHSLRYRLTSNYAATLTPSSPNGSVTSSDDQRIADPDRIASGQTTPAERLRARQNGPAQKPLQKLLFARAYPEHMAQITQWESNPTSPRFGKPVMYLIHFNDPRERIGATGTGLPIASINVHWTRVIHIADTHHTAATNPCIAVPRMRPVLRRILDLQKLYAGSAEGYWRGGCVPGYKITSHPQLAGDVVVDEAGMKQQIELFQFGLQKFLLGVGFDINTLSPQVADPSNQITKALEAIAIKLDIPMRVLMGSERGEQASQQDDDRWNAKKRDRQKMYITPGILRPFIRRNIMLGTLVRPNMARDFINEYQGGAGQGPLVKSGAGAGRPMGSSGSALNPYVKPNTAGTQELVPGYKGSKEPFQYGSQPYPNTPVDKQSFKPKLDRLDDTGERGADDEEDITSKSGEKREREVWEEGERGEIRTITDGYVIEWPDVEVVSKAQKIQLGSQFISAVTQFANGGASGILSPKGMYTKGFDFSEEETDAILADAKEDSEEGDTPPMFPRQGVMAINGIMQLIKAAGGKLKPEDLRGYLKLFFSLTDDQVDELNLEAMEEASPEEMMAMGGGGGGKPPGAGGGMGGGMGAGGGGFGKDPDSDTGEPGTRGGDAFGETPNEREGDFTANARRVPVAQAFPFIDDYFRRSPSRPDILWLPPERPTTNAPGVPGRLSTNRNPAAQEWDESKHPRDHGQFARKPGDPSHAAGHDSAADKAAHEMVKGTTHGGILGKIRRALSLANILNTARALVAKIKSLPGTVKHVFTHDPRITIRDAKKAGIEFLKEQHRQFGTGGCIAMAGAWVAYNAYAMAFNPAMYLIPVPLTPTIIASAKVTKALAVAAGFAKKAASAAQTVTGNTEGGSTPSPFSDTKSEHPGSGTNVHAPEFTLDEIVNATKSYIAVLARAAHQPTPPLSDHLLREVLKSLLAERGIVVNSQHMGQHGTCAVGQRADLTGCIPSAQVQGVSKQVSEAASQAGANLEHGTPGYHPGTAYGSAVNVSRVEIGEGKGSRVFTGKPVPVAHPITKQETGRLGEAIVVGYLKMKGLDDAAPMNVSNPAFSVDLLEDHRPTEVKAGVVSNGEKAQQWRLTFSQESATEKELYAQMTPAERRAWNADKQKRIHARKQRVINSLSEEYGVEITPRTITVIINPDTRMADVYEFDGFHDRIGWNSPMAKKAYKATVKYDHP